MFLWCQGQAYIDYLCYTEKKKRLVLVTLRSVGNRLFWAEHTVIFSCHINFLEFSWKMWESTGCHHSCCHSKCWGSNGLWCSHFWKTSGCRCCFRDGGCQEDGRLCCCLIIRGCWESKSCFSENCGRNRSLSCGGCYHWRGCMEKT